MGIREESQEMPWMMSADEDHGGECVHCQEPSEISECDACKADPEAIA